MQPAERVAQAIETMKIRAKALSPVHIGSYEQTLERTEYFVDRGRVYLADPTEIFKQLITTPADQKRWLENRESLTEIYQRQRGPRRPAADTLAFYSLKANSDLIGDNQYRPFERNGRGQPYIAGSSLKGALRNAWLYQYLDKHPEALTNLGRSLKQSYASFRKYNPRLDEIKKELDAKLDDNWARGGFVQGQSGIPADLFRMFGVSDSQPLDNEALAVEEIGVLCSKERGYDLSGDRILYEKRNTVLIQECLQENQTFEFSLNFNRKLREFYRGETDRVPVSLKDWLDKADAFARKLWEFEGDFLSDLGAKTHRSELRVGEMAAPGVGDFYLSDDVVPPVGTGWLLRLGAGSGILGVTPGLRLTPENEAEQKYLEDEEKPLEYWLGYFGFWRHERKAEVFPKSRKYVWRGTERDGDYEMPLGWLWLEEV